MRSFIIKSIQFLLLLFAVALILQMAISKRISGKTVNGQDNLEQTTGNFDLIFMGSSRCISHFDPLFFNEHFNLKSANLGIQGHSDINWAFTRLKDYLQRNKGLKYVILDFDPYVSTGSQEENKNYYMKDRFARYSFFPSSKDTMILNYFGFNIAERYFPLYSLLRYKKILDCILLNNISNVSDFGFEKLNENWDTSINTINKDLTKEGYFKNEDIPAIKNSLRQFADLCKKNGAQLLCIQTPIYKNMFYQNKFTQTGEICRDLNIPFIDANIPAIINDVSCFKDAGHLNGKGVNKLNDYLKSSAELKTFFNKKTDVTN